MWEVPYPILDPSYGYSSYYKKSSYTSYITLLSLPLSFNQLCHPPPNPCSPITPITSSPLYVTPLPALLRLAAACGAYTEGVTHGHNPFHSPLSPSGGPPSGTTVRVRDTRDTNEGRMLMMLGAYCSFPSSNIRLSYASRVTPAGSLTLGGN